MVLPLTLLIGIGLNAGLPNVSSLLACFLITAGFLAGTLWDFFFSHDSQSEPQADHLMIKTLVYGLGSSMMAAVNSHVIKRCFDAEKRILVEPSKLIYTNNFYSLIILTPIVLLKESGSMLSEFDGQSRLRVGVIMAGILASSVFGLLINLAGYLQIRATSPLSHTISASARGVLQTILACLVLHEHLSISRSLSIAIILIGTAIYTISNS
jgi:GDP-fucose transporter C1